MRVWQALLRVPAGSLVTYGALSSAVGTPRAARAIGSAVGANPLAFIIPCHRVIRGTGVLGNYRWDPMRKRAMIGWEATGQMSSHPRSRTPDRERILSCSDRALSPVSGLAIRKAYTPTERRRYSARAFRERRRRDTPGRPTTLRGDRRFDFCAPANKLRSFRMDSRPLDIAALRHDYVAHGLRRADLDPDPVRQFSKWFGEAAAAEIRDVNAMSLATATSDGTPSVRIVLLKGISERGFVFFTNYESDKGRELEQNPKAALNLFWVQLERQIRISGPVEKTSRAESEEYFHSRPVGSQLGAWASDQSGVIRDRETLEANLKGMTDRFGGGGVIPLPPHWGGYRVRPEMMEFWQGRTNRLHDRFQYLRQSDGGWKIERLSP